MKLVPVCFVFTEHLPNLEVNQTNFALKMV